MADYNGGKHNSSETKDMSNAIKMGAETAKTVKTVAKAGAQAASGNVVGAAVSVLKDPHTLRLILIIILIPVLLIACIGVIFLYALPTAIFESVSSYFASLGEEWKENVYGGDGGILWAGVVESIKTGGRVIGDAVSGIWNGLVNFFTKDDAVNDNSDKISDDGTELHITQEESAERETLNLKVDACIAKLEKRSEQIKDAITAQKSAINSYFKDKYAGTYDVWDGTTINIVTNNLTRSDAVKLLSAYTVVNEASLEGMELSDFMRWLGYYKETTGKNTDFDLGGNKGITAHAKTWCGTFMPQYLVEQMKQDIEICKEEANDYFAEESSTQNAIKQIEEDYESYQGPAVDLLLVVDCPDFNTVHATYYTKTTLLGKKVVHCSVSIPISIGTRSVDSLAYDIIGFWDGEAPAA